MKSLVYALAALLSLAQCIWSAPLDSYCMPSQSCWPSQDIENFKVQMNASGGGRVQTPNEADWPSIGLTYNLAESKVPGFIVYVLNVDAIKKALEFAKEHNIRVSTVSSGHSFYGRCTAEGSMQISVHYMKGITMDMNCKENPLGCITTQTGVQWGEAFREASKVNRVVVGGSNPTVSVAGWTLGGGHSPLSRMFGLGVDNVLSLHLVTADLSEVWTSQEGQRIEKVDGTVIENNDTSLFWAMRGGGSVFGVVIDITFRLHMDSEMVQFVCSYPAYQDGTAKTFKVMYDSLGPFFTSAPKTFSGYIIPSIGCDPASKQCGGTSLVSLLHYGPLNDSTDAAWIKKFSDLPQEWKEAGLTDGNCYTNNYDSFYEYELTIPNVTYTALYLGGSLIQQNLVSDSMTDTLIKHFDIAYERAKRNPAYNLVVTATWVGGTVTEVPINTVPVHAGWRNAVFSLTTATMWDIRYVKVPPAQQIQGVKDVHADLARYSNGKYYNEAELDMKPQEWKTEFWGNDMYEKLLKIKKAWDPQNMFTCTACVGSDWQPKKKPTDTVVG